MQIGFTATAFVQTIKNEICTIETTDVYLEIEKHSVNISIPFEQIVSKQ